MDGLLGMDLESSEAALRTLAASVVHHGARADAARAAPFLVALLEHGERPTMPHAILGLLARIAVIDADAIACGRDATQGGALEATTFDAHADRDAVERCSVAVVAGRGAYLRWLGADDASARCAAAHLLAFVARGDSPIDEALAARARDEEEDEAVRASSLFALGVRGTASRHKLPCSLSHDVGGATLLEAGIVFARLASKDAAMARAAERDAVDVLARGIVGGPPASGVRAVPVFPWPEPEHLLLGRLGCGKGRAARAQSALLRMLATARDRGRAERIASALLVLAFGEPNAAAFSEWEPRREIFPGASAWTVEQRAVLGAIAAHDVLWPTAAEQTPSVRHVDASEIQLALKRMLVLPYYPSRKGLRAAIALVVIADAGGVRR
jgi:hypothetical protein